MDSRHLPALLGRRDILDLAVEIDALDRVADIAPVEDRGDVRQRHHDEAPLVFAQAVLDARAHILELERVLLVGALRVAHRDAGLPDALDALDDERLVAVMERLVAPEEQGGRLLRVEHRAQVDHRLLGPVFRRAFRGDAQVMMFRRHEHLVGVLERALLDAVDPDHERLAAG